MKLGQQERECVGSMVCELQGSGASKDSHAINQKPAGLLEPLSTASSLKPGLSGIPMLDGTPSHAGNGAIGAFPLVHRYTSHATATLQGSDSNHFARLLAAVLTVEHGAVSFTSRRSVFAYAGAPPPPQEVITGGMILPFQPLCLTFAHVNYYVPMPKVSIHALIALSLAS